MYIYLVFIYGLRDTHR